MKTVMKTAGLFTWHVLQIGASYALAIPLFLFIQGTGLFWRMVEGQQSEKSERAGDRQRQTAETLHRSAGGKE